MKEAKINLKETNLRIWSKVSKTDPKNTKYVKPYTSNGRGFTAIDAYSQVQQATEELGPCGEGWGWTKPEFDIMRDLVTKIYLNCELSIWQGSRENLIPVSSSAVLVNDKAFSTRMFVRS